MNSDQKTMTTPVFHLSIHVEDLATSRGFYGGALGCTEGRSTEQWVDFDFFGHQLSLHLGEPLITTPTGVVDGVSVPMPHFGAVLPAELWQATLQRLRDASVNFVLEPQERYANKTGAQQTLFVLDPSNNAIELKCMADNDQLFRSEDAR